MSQMFIVKHPMALPGCCKMCGISQREWFIDTGTLEEFYGAVYYCNECFTSMVELTNTSEFSQNITDEKNLKSEIRLLRAANERLSERCEQLERIAGAVITSRPDPVPATERTMGEKAASGRAYEGTFSMDFRESGPSEPFDDKGMAKLPGFDIDF